MNTENTLAPDLRMFAVSQDETDKQQLQGNVVCLTLSEGHKMPPNPDQRGDTQSLREDGTWGTRKRILVREMKRKKQHVQKPWIEK